ncbi:MAG: hypothetical protein WCI55_11575 [Armatimonadota bacterium]
MFERFLVKKEKLSFRESIQRAPNLSIARDGHEFASIEFGSLTLYIYRSESNSFVGSCGIQYEGRDSKDMYLAIFDRHTKRKVVEALATQSITSRTKSSVISIENFEICKWSDGDGFTRIQKQDGEDLGFLRWGAKDDEIYAKVDIASNLLSTEQEYILILLLLYTKRAPWYAFFSSTSIGVSADYPGSE